MVAYEIASRLQQQGRDIRRVFVIDSMIELPEWLTPLQKELRHYRGLGSMLTVLWQSRRGRSRMRARYRRAVLRYRPPTFKGPLTVIYSEASRAARSWARFASQVDVHVLPGDHLTLLVDHQDVLAAVIREALVETL